ncbi:nitrilase family protein [Croceitalea sp. MTPC9]|uniref:amidohydrolase n=1 Tax=unclassified Croceitalea TaxID=2632280 RepID=UPI002B3688C8|nr:nitrilase family protein [Croceitalea sp. MTPC6]GMN16837.1 nitrilase family protein [Croceitalea sp. MTPC9]
MENELKVALIQSHLLWENPEANRKVFSEKINSITSAIDLIILPEMFTTGFTMKPENINVGEGDETLDWMKKEASKKQTAIMGSVVFKEGKRFYNRLFFVYPNGKVDKYDKKHTFTLAGEHKIYESGKSKTSVDFKGFKICPLICYDLRFPVWARNTEDYDVLIYVANWPKPRIEAWDTLLKARAIENMSYCIGVNRIGLDGLGHEYSGHSAVYDVLGKRLVYSEKEEVLYGFLSKEHIKLNRDKLKFLEDRDHFNLL